MSCRIKICCISSVEEARLAISHGADALGLVGKMPSGPGPIADELIATIAATIYPPITSFLLTSEQSADAIVAHVNRVHTNTVQIVDELTAGSYQHIRQQLPHLKIVQVIHVTGEESIEQALAIQDHVDAILLDSGNPKAAIKTLAARAIPITGRSAVNWWNPFPYLFSWPAVSMLVMYRKPSPPCNPLAWMFAAACAATGYWTLKNFPAL